MKFLESQCLQSSAGACLTVKKTSFVHFPPSVVSPLPLISWKRKHETQFQLVQDLMAVVASPMKTKGPEPRIFLSLHGRFFLLCVCFLNIIDLCQPPPCPWSFMALHFSSGARLAWVQSLPCKPSLLWLWLGPQLFQPQCPHLRSGDHDSAYPAGGCEN